MMWRKSIISILMLGFALLGKAQSNEDVISLAGKWRVALDPTQTGFSEKWFKKPLPTVEQLYPHGTQLKVNNWIDLPGDTDHARIGTPLSYGEDMVNKDMKSQLYDGAYWVQQEFQLPVSLKGKNLYLTMCRLPEGSKIYWNGSLVGEVLNYSLPEQIRISSVKTKGEIHLLTIFVNDSRGKKQVTEVGGVILYDGHKEFPLDGQWNLALDVRNIGVRDQWYNGKLPSLKDLHIYYETYFRGADYTISDSLALPGSPTKAGIGTCLNPGMAFTEGMERKISYENGFWVQRKVEIPSHWKNCTLTFLMERIVGLSRAYWDGVLLGECHGYEVPHQHSIPASLVSEGEHTITVYTQPSDREYPQSGHGVKSENGSRWNGIIGRIEFIKRKELEGTNIQVYPDIYQNRILVDLDIVKRKINDKSVTVRFSIREKRDGAAFIPLKTIELVSETDTCRNIEIDLPFRAKRWDEYAPNLYELKTEVGTAQRISDHTITTFGMRDFTSCNGHFLLNGRRIFLRNTQQNGTSPLHNYTPMDKKYWMDIMQTTKDYGLNSLRFHSWCPPEMAFEAADETGLILQIEAPHDIKGIPSRPYKELKRILQTYGNHPSFCLMTLGNERFNHDEISRAALSLARKMDPRHLYSCSSHPYHAHCTDDFFITAWGVNKNRPDGWGNPIVGIEWGGGDVVSTSRFNTRAPQTTYDYREELAGIKVPVISHEVGQWAMYPDLKMLERYTGVLRNSNYERIKMKLTKQGLLGQADLFAKASGAFSALLYKEEMESALRTPNLSGFSLLGLNDFLGQNLSVVGVLNEFWESKGIVSPEEHRQYCASIVALARMNKRIFSQNDTLEAIFEIAHYGKSTLKNVTPRWKLITEKGKIIISGKLERKTISVGGLAELGKIQVDLSTLSKASKCRLCIEIPGTSIRNQWDLWVYPKDQESNIGKVKLCKEWNERTQQLLEAGETVLLTPSKEMLREGYRDSCFVPVFWNSLFKWMQKNHTLGILCDLQHPLFADFPTECHSNWQWWDIMMHAHAMYISGWPVSFTPLLQAIDSYSINDRLAYMVEGKVGKGKLIISMIDLENDLENRLAACQLKRCLYDYMNSSRFMPVHEISPEMLNDLFIEKK